MYALAIPQYIVSITTLQLYASLLSIGSVLAVHWAPVLTRHNITVLLVTFGVYAYRDLWQLATFDFKPIDASEGWLLWFEIGVLALVSIAIPLFIPRRYVPVDSSVGLALSLISGLCLMPFWRTLWIHPHRNKRHPFSRKHFTCTWTQFSLKPISCLIFPIMNSLYLATMIEQKIWREQPSQYVTAHRPHNP